MRGFGVAVLVALAGAAAATAQDAAARRVAVIDVQQVVESSAAGREALARLKKLNDEKVAEGAKMVTELEALQKQLAAQRATLSEERIKSLQKQIEDKQVALERFRDDAQEFLDEARRKELQALEARILPIINEIGREMKLHLIFNKFQSGLVYADDSVDITDEVLKRFNVQVAR
ncbi:MAG: OmpH family outer membrane protein [Acidobacteriota bacterium]|jgi:outer membrane protein